MSIEHILRRRRRVDSRFVAAALGAVTGVRTTAGLTALAHSGHAPSLLARATEFMASGELIADKAANLPARTRPAPLIGRTGLGAAAAGFYAHRRRLPLALAHRLRLRAFHTLSSTHRTPRHMSCCASGALP